MAKKLPSLVRAPRFNRFQTAVFGSFVPTAANAHFDPMQEGRRRPKRSKQQMEQVERIQIPDPSR